MILAQLSSTLCGTENPSLFGAFDLTTPPPLLFYSYVPITLVVVLLGLFILWSAHGSRESRWLSAVAIAFAGWVVDILMQWVASYHELLLFSWQLNAIFEVGLFLAGAGFAYVYCYQRGIPDWLMYALGGIGLATLAAIPTSLNIQSYDVDNCQGVVGPLWLIIYAFEPAVVILIAYMGFDAARHTADTTTRHRIALAATGTALALGTFSFSNYYGELTQAYDFNLWGPIGMVAFQLLLGYMIVRYKAFNAKVFATQALVVTLIVITGSELFFVANDSSRILVSLSLVLTLVFGWLLERSVKAEIMQREKIEAQERELATINAQQTSLLHFMSHEVKGSLNKAQGVFAGLIEGDYGALSDEARGIATNALSEVAKGIAMVMDILSASDLKKGTVSFDMKPFDCTHAVVQAVDDARAAARSKGIHLELMTPPSGTIILNGDATKLTKNVFRNLLDNAVKYTPTGYVHVSLTRAGTLVRFSVEDSGVGISPEDMQKLFTEGGHGTDSRKVNVDSTGYGLFIAKSVVDAHHGRIWGESDGAGKGSRFVVELPAA
jgi:signal transduction histidine kinase